MIRPLVLSLAITLTLSLANPAGAISLGAFTCITNNDAGNCAIGEASLSADLLQIDADSAELALTMTGIDAAVVEEVFFESPFLVGGYTMRPSGSVDALGSESFFGAISPGIVSFGFNFAPSLPGGSAVGFVEDSVSIIADGPVLQNGVGFHDLDPTSDQTVFIEIRHDGSFEELVASLRIGVHVVGFDVAGSESFVTPTVPEPSAALLIGLGLAAVASRRRRA